jgi:hypothetical protein
MWVAALLTPAIAHAQAEPPVTVSSQIADVAVTVYRAPNRGGGGIDRTGRRGSPSSPRRAR